MSVRRFKLHGRVPINALLPVVRLIGGAGATESDHRKPENAHKKSGHAAR